ncbi:MAG: DNA repair protein RecO [Candidatus Methylacidiphilales bacterium]|nr:DNA repair protein RecO [Candidatus Methylacidiphilales bacterium]
MNTRDSGVIVHCLPYSETSVIAVWMSENHGILRTLAKGARRPKQPLFGLVDAYRAGSFGFRASRTSQLHTLVDFAPERYYPGLASDYARGLCASYFYEVIARLSEPQHPQPEIHQLYLKALDYLDHRAPTPTLVGRFEKRLFELLGLHDPGCTHRVLRQRLLHPLPKTWQRLATVLGES